MAKPHKGRFVPYQVLSPGWAAVHTGETPPDPISEPGLPISRATDAQGNVFQRWSVMSRRDLLKASCAAATALSFGPSVFSGREALAAEGGAPVVGQDREGQVADWQGVAQFLYGQRF